MCHKLNQQCINVLNVVNERVKTVEKYNLAGVYIGKFESTWYINLVLLKLDMCLPGLFWYFKVHLISCKAVITLFFHYAFFLAKKKKKKKRTEPLHFLHQITVPGNLIFHL